MKKNGTFINKIVLITEGSNEFGKAAIDSFMKEGAKVIAWDSEGKTLVLQDNEDAASLYRNVDVSDAEMVEIAVAEIARIYGRIDVLINCSGITRDASRLTMTQEEWQGIIENNLQGIMNCCKSV